jgi:hypothetical protein
VKVCEAEEEGVTSRCDEELKAERGFSIESHVQPPPIPAERAGRGLDFLEEFY